MLNAAFRGWSGKSSGEARIIKNPLKVLSAKAKGGAIIGGGGKSQTNYAGPVSLAGDVFLEDEALLGTWFSGKISGKGNVNISKGQVHLANANNDFKGTIKVFPGTELISENQKAIPEKTIVILNSGSWILGPVGTYSINGLNGHGTVKVMDNKDYGNRLLMLGSKGGSGWYRGKLSDGSSGRLTVVKLGRGTQVLDGDSDYSGDTIINGGIMRAGSPTAFGKGVIIVERRGTLELNGQKITNVIINHGGTVIP